MALKIPWNSREISRNHENPVKLPREKFESLYFKTPWNSRNFNSCLEKAVKISDPVKNKVETLKIPWKTDSGYFLSPVCFGYYAVTIWKIFERTAMSKRRNAEKNKEKIVLLVQSKWSKLHTWSFYDDQLFFYHKPSKNDGFTAWIYKKKKGGRETVQCYSQAPG